MNNDSRTYMRWWFWSGAGLVTLMLLVGGITRLTGSGLSMTDWNLIMGIIPPTTESAWQEVFNRYKEFPEYQQLKLGMTLGEFKAIFFWEYFHRLLARGTWVYFLFSFAWLWLRGHMNDRLMRRALYLFVLGAAQGMIGWFMVKSGLVDVPRVSHYRLALHLVFAFVVAGLCSWYALDLRKEGASRGATVGKGIMTLIKVTSILLVLQIVWGAFVAGLDAGNIYNTFPLMNGGVIPRNMMALEPMLLNLVENPGTVQWVHRLLGTLVVGAAAWTWFRNRTGGDPVLGRRLKAFLGLIIFQYFVGVLTVLLNVQIAVGVFHQLIAMIAWISWLLVMHRIYTLRAERGKIFDYI